MKRKLSWLGLVPFTVYIFAFLVVPTLLAVGSGFVDAAGGFTWGNFSVYENPVVWRTFGSSTLISMVTAVIGAVVGALVCWALTGVQPGGPIRRAMDAAASVLAQFGGVMLAFAFIATMGAQSILRIWLRDTWGVDIYAEGVWLYELPGLVLPYLYFQIPLMVITFLPAIERLRPQWAESSATLGATRWQYWRYVGFPVLAPSFLGALLLLFANSFSSYATAAALISQGAQIVPLQIRAALIGETGASVANTAGVLALGMIIVMAVVMSLYSLLMRRAARWQQ
ncbi:MAG: ABC transporter permease subunit [Micrococcaceae bacterium]|nr:ABC transporter permease subunit [Micrococcaceae bacterium]